MFGCLVVVVVVAVGQKLATVIGKNFGHDTVKYVYIPTILADVQQGFNFSLKVNIVCLDDDGNKVRWASAI